MFSYLLFYHIPYDLWCDCTRSLEQHSPNNPFYDAIAKNQKIWREAKHGMLNPLYPHEMPHVSEKIEQNMKRIFSNFLDPSYPRVILARTVLVDTSLDYQTPLFRYGSEYGVPRYPESVKPEDQQFYGRGINSLNEWATNYATRNYLTQTSKTPLTKPLRQLYAQVADTLTGKLVYSQAYNAMADVRKTAKTANQDFDSAVFQGLFQHNFTQLDTLIASTNNLQATTLNELAIAIGKGAEKSTDMPMPNLPHVIETARYVSMGALEKNPTDSHMMKSMKTTGVSILAAGQFVVPGIVEVGIAGPIAGFGIPILEGTVLGEPQAGAIVGGAVLGTTAACLAFTAVHETVHGYSAADNYVGLIPEQLYGPSLGTAK